MTLNKEQKLPVQASTTETNFSPRFVYGNIASSKPQAYMHKHYITSPLNFKLLLSIFLLDISPRISNKCHYHNVAKSMCPNLLLLNSHHLLSYMTLLSTSVFKQETWGSVFISHFISPPTSTPSAVQNIYQTLQLNFPFYY